jgi:hypothetical protein
MKMKINTFRDLPVLDAVYIYHRGTLPVLLSSPPLPFRPICQVGGQPRFFRFSDPRSVLPPVCWA